MDNTQFKNNKKQIEIMANGIIWKDGTITYMNSKGEVITTPQPKN